MYSGLWQYAYHVRQWETVFITAGLNSIEDS